MDVLLWWTARQQDIRIGIPQLCLALGALNPIGVWLPPVFHRGNRLPAFLVELVERFHLFISAMRASAKTTASWAINTELSLPLLAMYSSP